MDAAFATITSRMRFNFFSRNRPDPDQPAARGDVDAGSAARTPSGKTFPADEIVWGIAVRNGFDEIDDPWYHKGVTQHAYLEGHDYVAICGFRPPQSGPRTRRRSRLGLPTPGQHPMCGTCARMVVAPRPRVPIPIQPGRPAVAVPVQPVVPRAVPAGVAPQSTMAGAPASVARNGTLSGPAAVVTSPWIQQRTAAPNEPHPISVEMSGTHDGGLLARGVHTQLED